MRVLLADPGRRWTVGELSRLAGVEFSRAAREVKGLIAARYLDARTLGVVRPMDLLDFFALGWHVDQVPGEGFQVLERAEYWASQVARIAEHHGLEYALTGLSGADVVAPLIVPVQVEMYIPDASLGEWTRRLEEAGAHRSGGGREGRVRLLQWKHADHAARELRGFRVVSTPQLFADLRCRPGPMVEAAAAVKEAWDVRSR